MPWGIFILSVLVLIVSVITIRVSATLFPRPGPKGYGGLSGMDGQKGMDGKEGPPGINVQQGTINMITNPLLSPYTPEEAYELGTGVYYQLVNGGESGNKYTIYTTFVIRAEESLSLLSSINTEPRTQNVMQSIIKGEGSRYYYQMREATITTDNRIVWSPFNTT